jgi:SAM-dependent methyltransferase
MPDPIGHAISDYYHRTFPGKLWIHNTYGPKEEMPIAIYFRDIEEMPEMERVALQVCEGRVLDIGAGAGSHVLWLQDYDFDVAALEISPNACQVMRKRGVRKIIKEDIMLYQGGKYNTLLLLMNGIGLTHSILGFRDFLHHAETLLEPGGQLLFDSSDVAYLYQGGLPRPAHYYGEVKCRYEYKKQKSPWFSWLYIDRNTMSGIAAEEGWSVVLLSEDDHGQYLVQLKKTDGL